MISKKGESPTNGNHRSPLAIVGIGCRFPGDVHDVDSFWELLENARSGIVEVPENRWNRDRFYHPNAEIPGKMITKWGGFLSNLEQFDAQFFGISPREALRMDPQQRWLLEVSWEALEDAGIPPGSLRGTHVGVFVGIASNDYASIQMRNYADVDVHTNSGSTLSIASNRISYLFDFKGPSVSVDTACSSALVAVNLACQSVWSGECEAALAGGVNAILTPDASIGFSKASMLSPTGQCFAFDDRANGYVRGEGAGMIVIKPLEKAREDGDPIYAVIRAAVINQDGNTSSMTVPGMESQEEMLQVAYAQAGLAPSCVCYMEAHGTGTPVGDPIETNALGHVLSQGRPGDRPCLIGSVKTNIGHLESGSGIAGLIKAALVLHKDTVPPNLNFKNPNPNIDFEELKLKVADRLQSLPHAGGAPAVAAVNSFGFGGTNAHIVLEEAPSSAKRLLRSGKRASRPFVLPLSARDELCLHHYAQRFREFLTDPDISLADVCYSAGARREHHEAHRVAIIGKDRQELRDRLKRWMREGQQGEGIVTGRPAPEVGPAVFVFTGQGAQWWAMGQQLLEREPVFSRTIEKIEKLLTPLAGWSLVEEMTRSEEDSNINRTSIAQPAIFALQVALVELWKSWGVEPSKVIGHSVGEVAAAYCAGIYTLEDAVTVIYHRSRLQDTTGGAGRMVAVGIPVAEARKAIRGHEKEVQVAVINSPSLLTLAGDTAPLESIVAKLEADGKFVRWLRIDYAFHSHQMEPIKEELLKTLAGIKPKASRIPFVSTVTGGVVPGQEMDAHYWWRNVREPVVFGPAVAGLIRGGEDLFLEIGPHPALQSSISECLADQNRKGAVFHTLQRKSDESLEMLQSAGALHIHGVKVDWAGINQSAGNFVKLPSYPWRRESFWLESGDSEGYRLGAIEHPLLGTRVTAPKPTWQFDLDPRLFTYLDDHRFWDSIIFPASGYGEIGLALARALFAGEPYVVENIETKKALFVSENKVPTVQVVYDESEKYFYVYSATTGKRDWDLNAQGRLQKLSPSAPAPVDLREIRKRLPEHFDHDAYYDEYARAGYQFGPNFQHLQNVWRRESESLSEIVVPEGVCDTVKDYHFHPAVLDACFHTVKGAQVIPEGASPRDYFYLPAAIHRIRLYVERPPTRLWGHASILRDDGHSLLSNILVYDDDGNRVADIIGFRVDRVDQKEAGDGIDGSCFQFRWEPCRLPGTGLKGSPQLASTGEIVHAVKKAVPAIYQEYHLSDLFNEYRPRLEKIILQFIQNAYLKLGWKPRVGDRVGLDSFVKELGIIEQHHRLVRAELKALEKHGWLRVIEEGVWEVAELPHAADTAADLDKLASDFPQFSSEVTLEKLTGPHLAEVLSGEEDPLELLFPGGSPEHMERFYREGGDFPANNQLIREAVTTAIKSLPPRRALRVLEVGAGTGSLTRAVLPALPADRTEYTFTDNGGGFLVEARKHFADYPFVDFKVFDIEQDPQQQGIDLHGYDLILATNVIHATSDVRQALKVLQSCLASEGLFIFLEVTERLPSNDNVFGLLKGWWQYTDTDLRPQSALLGRFEWEKVLKDCGFSGVTSFVNSAREEETLQSVLVSVGPRVTAKEIAAKAAPAGERDPSAPADSDPAPVPADLVFVDSGGVADALASELESPARRVIRVSAGHAFAITGKDEFLIVPGSEEDIRKVLQESGAMENPPARILHFWSLDHPTASELTHESLEQAQATGVLSVLNLARILGTNELPAAPCVHIVSRGMQSVIEGEGGTALASAPTAGLLRVARNELQDFGWRLIDLDPTKPDTEFEDLINEFTLGDDEFEVAHRGGRRYANRLHNVKPDDLPRRSHNAMQPDGTVLPYRLQIDKPGILANLSLNETVRRDPEPEEIEVIVKAGGINFRDVMKALGMYPGNPVDLKWFGDDFSGTVVRTGSKVKDLRPGDNVVGMAPYCFRSYVTVHRHMVFKKPKHISFEEAATLPTVFLTSHYALNHLAHLRKGEKILIHAGTGGVGQAAIQIAKHLGLEIFSTAGTPEKRKLLKGMGVHHVMDSRSLDFADEIMEITGGRGVDAVLNSLAGDFIPKSFSVLAPFGRFLEIGKIDIYNNSKIGLEPLRNNISYFVIDLAQHLQDKPEFVASLFGELAKEFFAGTYEPLPHKVFPVTDVVEAFRYMAQGKHIGKNVLSFHVDEIPVGPCTEDGHLFRADAAYLITGGAGGFGLELAKWMARNGARNLVLMSRSGPRQENSREAIEQIRSQGVIVVDARGDVTNATDIERVLDDIGKKLPPLRGVIHGAMVLDDDFMSEFDSGRFSRVLHPKMLGAWNLHQLTLDFPLEHFICFSSVSAIVGAPRQANYNAGNFFLDALAHYRHSLGLPALTINWGALAEAGFVARNEKTAQYLELIGLRAFSMDETLKVFRRMLPLDPIQIAAAHVDWKALAKLAPAIGSARLYAPVARAQSEGEAGGSVRPRILAAAPDEQQRLVEDFIIEQVAGVFGTDPSKIDRDTPLTNLGLDSLMAIELMNRIEDQLGMSLPMGSVLNGPNIRELSQPVLQSLLASAGSENQSAAGGGSSGTPIDKAETEVLEFPLSQGQSALWFLNRLAPDSSAYNLIFSAKFIPHVDIEIMAKAFASLYERHPMLDVTFSIVDGQLVQRLRKGRTIDFREHDASHLSDDEIKALLMEHANKPFDIHSGPVVRLEMFRTSGDAHIALLCMHHIVSDAWSVTVLLSDLIEGYFSIKAGKTPRYKHKPLEFRYSDFVSWEQKHLESEAGSRMRDYWTQQLADAPLLLDLPTDRPRPPVQTFNGATHGFKLDEDLTKDIVDLAGEMNATLFSALLSAFEVLLHRYCNQDDLLVGCPLAGRNQSELHQIVGYFINPVALRSKVDDDPAFSEFLTRTGSQVAGALENQQYPLARLVDDLRVPRDPSRSPVFQVSFSMERIPGFDENGIAVFLIGQGGHRFHVGDVTMETVDLTLRQAQFEITLVVEEAGGNIYGCWQYNRDLFEPETIAHLNDLYAQVLKEVVRKPDRRISEINLLPKAEERRIVETWNATEAAYPKRKLLHEIVAEQAQRTPDAEAICCGRDTLTFGELDARANGLAALLREEGIGPDMPVALLMERSPDMVAGSLGIIKAGGCYVPMDPDFPSYRLEQMLKDAQPSVVVTQSSLLKSLPAGSWKVVTIDQIESADKAPVIGDLTPESLAYIIYTSGSTGTPKGVEIPHRAAVNFLTSMLKEPGLSTRDRLLAVTTLSFDISLLELYLPLLAGAKVVIATREDARDGRRLSALLEEFDITVMQATPATWQMLLDAGWEGKSDLRIFCGGESLSRELANTLANSAKEVWNLYGPTETTVWSACDRVHAGSGTVSIGRPIANTTIFVLDHHLKPVPAGFAGDLYIGGEGLARGYHRQDNLTREKFIRVDLPNGKSERIYTTGDLARWTRDGKLECLGRSDFQIKLRGVRMELEDIESQIQSHPRVKQAVVAKRDDLPGGPSLVAYFIPKDHDEALIPDLRNHVADRLPEAMRPAFYVALEKLPLTPNRKIDRKRLPTPRVDRAGLEGDFVPPQTPSEKVLWEIFHRTFETEKIGIRDNFFELGGDSLLAVRILSEVSSAFNRDVPVGTFLKHPTIEQLARFLHLPAEAAAAAVGGAAAERVASGGLPTADHLSVEFTSASEDSAPPQVDAVALTYIPDQFLTMTGMGRDELVRNWFDGKPRVSNLYELSLGRIGVVILPCFELDLYKNGEIITRQIIDALELSSRMGAKNVSLTGVIPSATDYGRDILKWIGGREDLPEITTGDATRTATIVKSMEGILSEARRDLSGECVAMIGLGSIGRGTLRLMLDVFPHPREIILCDPYQKTEDLKAIHDGIASAGFNGKVRLVSTPEVLPDEIYDASFIIGTTGLPGILDTSRLRPGTLIVDYSFPPMFRTSDAVRRLEENHDILFTTGGQLRLNEEIKETIFLPKGLQSLLESVNSRSLQAFVSRNPEELTGCVLASLTTGLKPDIHATTGPVSAEDSRRHYRFLEALKVTPAKLQMENYFIPADKVEKFRKRKASPEVAVGVK